MEIHRPRLLRLAIQLSKKIDRAKLKTHLRPLRFGISCDLITLRMLLEDKTTTHKTICFMIIKKSALKRDNLKLLCTSKKMEKEIIRLWSQLVQILLDMC
jgi:hypothetical protein